MRVSNSNQLMQLKKVMEKAKVNKLDKTAGTKIFRKCIRALMNSKRGINLVIM